MKPEDLTDEMIREMRDGPLGLHSESLRDDCRVALQRFVEFTPFCRRCGWRKGGVDSWDGAACKCGNRAGKLYTCCHCGGLGTVPYNVGSQPCPSCKDGSGFVNPAEIHHARQRICDAINERAKREGETK